MPTKEQQTLLSEESLCCSHTDIPIEFSFYGYYVPFSRDSDVTFFMENPSTDVVVLELGAISAETSSKDTKFGCCFVLSHRLKALLHFVIVFSASSTEPSRKVSRN
jgi:hypothetical protein